MNYSYYELISVCESIEEKLDTLILLLQQNLTPILYVITFFVLLKVGLTCLRGYKV